jgi:hypothetical protein
MSIFMRSGPAAKTGSEQNQPKKVDKRQDLAHKDKKGAFRAICGLQSGKALLGILNGLGRIDREATIGFVRN